MSTTVDFRAMASATDHRDADLLDAIEHYTTMMQSAYRSMRRANQLQAEGRAYRRVWREILASRDERERLEQLICTTKARTPLGAIAKGQLWLEQHADNSGSLMDLPRAAITELVTMLEGVGA